MDTALWNSIVNFNIDGPVGAYNFSTRLENENYWSTNFAATAILEYKKFMYLAAVSGSMVSPSEIVDVVWHQHLVFTQSYDEFCSVLGKKIAHVPSTHHKDDFSKFKLAGDRTQKLYAETFGEQPAEIWNYSTVYDPLNMEKAAFNTTKVIGVGAILLIPALCLAYFLLGPVYVTIYNPDFIFGYAAIIIVSILCLSFYNVSKLKAMIGGWEKYAFAFNLSALELICLQKNNTDSVIHGVVNQLITAGNISIQKDDILAVTDFTNVTDPTLYCVLQTIEENPETVYPKLVNILKLKPAFNKTTRAMDALKKYVSRSKQFIRLFILNFAIMGIVLLLGAVRLVTGLVREKPVTIIAGAIIVCLVIMIVNLYWLTIAIGSVTLPKFYSKNIVYESKEYNNWDWQYFILGTAVFESSFLPLTSYGNNGSYTSDSGSSSCGSSCGGSSCGGCGGN